MDEFGHSVASAGDTNADGYDDIVVGAPFISSGMPLFRGRQDVTLGSSTKDAEITYTIDGSLPDSASPRYERPIAVTDSVTLRAVARVSGAASPVMTAAFRRLSDYPRVTLSARYAPQYSAGGDDALVDGVRGTSNFRVGRWQGYLGTDLDVTLDFGAPREFRHISMGFLQDAASWILMPRRVVVSVSDDGINFRGLGAIANTPPEREMNPVTRDFDLEASGRARYVRLHVERYGKLPAWHPGAGNEAWFFADEILVTNK
jgi:hypothetical protein